MGLSKKLSNTSIIWQLFIKANQSRTQEPFHQKQAH